MRPIRRIMRPIRQTMRPIRQTMRQEGTGLTISTRLANFNALTLCQPAVLFVPPTLQLSLTLRPIQVFMEMVARYSLKQ